ncbi:hypothetical protein A9G45_04950 [Gilliamella sp. HK2]|jgi:hypothetical protein|uniref:hypothetical protein n=1 Tax=unclassified Gilliamella TaxID=2685620 RepID=UPI00080E4832|nr:hypothetical protein [Gilliamella apicola]OCG29198.1 hypothetical protein A9G45_04950 [Gilliamella apicola]OCG30188.1 hypothetical protein A9G46_11995 [Gilliamella apicola]
MSILVCISYYFLSIVGFFIRYYFSGYIATDYANDKTLNRKRRWAILFYCFMALFSRFMIDKPGEGIFSHIIFLWWDLLILIFYIYFIDFLVRPKRYKKRKKWK